MSSIPSSAPNATVSFSCGCIKCDKSTPQETNAVIAVNEKNDLTVAKLISNTRGVLSVTANGRTLDQNTVLFNLNTDGELVLMYGQNGLPSRPTITQQPITARSRQVLGSEKNDPFNSANNVLFRNRNATPTFALPKIVQSPSSSTLKSHPWMPSHPSNKVTPSPSPPHSVSPSPKVPAHLEPPALHHIPHKVPTPEASLTESQDRGEKIDLKKR